MTAFGRISRPLLTLRALPSGAPVMTILSTFPSTYRHA